MTIVEIKKITYLEKSKFHLSITILRKTKAIDRPSSKDHLLLLHFMFVKYSFHFTQK